MTTVGGSTLIEKDGSQVVSLPSLTPMRMAAVEPTSPAPGVPRTAPVLASNFAQLGSCSIKKVRGSPSASVDDGAKVNSAP
jgi:hypothetical protein